MDCAFGLLALVLSLQFVLPAPVDLIPPDWKLNKAADPNELVCGSESNRTIRHIYLSLDYSHFGSQADK